MCAERLFQMKKKSIFFLCTDKIPTTRNAQQFLNRAKNESQLFSEMPANEFNYSVSNLFCHNNGQMNECTWLFLNEFIVLMKFKILCSEDFSVKIYCKICEHVRPHRDNDRCTVCNAKHWNEIMEFQLNCSCLRMRKLYEFYDVLQAWVSSTHFFCALLYTYVDVPPKH